VSPPASRRGARWVTAFLSLAAVLTGCSLDYGKDQAPPADQVPLMVFENLKQTGVKDGRTLYTMETAGSETYPSKKEVRLKRFRFQEYDSQGRPASAGEAESAVIDTGSNDATLRGRLTVRSEEQGVTLTVEGGPNGGLTWANDDRILKTLPETGVELTKDDGSKIDTRSLVLDLGTNRLQLEEGVQGTWTPEANHDANSLPPPIDPPSAPAR
jgi:hypothetical protein